MSEKAGIDMMRCRRLVCGLKWGAEGQQRKRTFWCHCGEIVGKEGWLTSRRKEIGRDVFLCLID